MLCRTNGGKISHTAPAAGVILISALPSSETFKTVQSPLKLLLLAKVWRSFCSLVFFFCSLSPSDHWTKNFARTSSLICYKINRARARYSYCHWILNKIAQHTPCHLSEMSGHKWHCFKTKKLGHIHMNTVLKIVSFVPEHCFNNILVLYGVDNIYAT